MKYYERQVRMLDDPSKRVSDMARDISLQLGVSISICQGYIHAKRTGHASLRSYLEFLAKARGFDSATELTKFRRAQKEHGRDYTLEQFKTNKSISVREQRVAEYFRNSSVPMIYLDYEPSKTEKQIRALDNPSLNIATSARNASKQTGWSYVSCFGYISSMRRGITEKINTDMILRKRGFIDYYEYGLYLDEKSKNPEITLGEFRADRAKKHGFGSSEDHVKFLEDRRLFFQRKESQKKPMHQKEFEYNNLEFRDERGLRGIVYVERSFPLDSEDGEAFWQFIEDTLNPQQYQVICGTFVEGNSFRKIGKTMGLSGARIAQIKTKSIKKLRHPYRLTALKEFLS